MFALAVIGLTAFALSIAVRLGASSVRGGRQEPGLAQALDVLASVALLALAIVVVV